MDWNEPSTWVVLVVDDEPDNLDLVVETLQYYGATVKAAANGRLALAILDAFTPNLILLDLSMPELDGWELHQRLRAAPAWTSIPVLAMTAHAMVGDRERAMQAGFDGYITKPISVPTLLLDIQQAYSDGRNKES